MYCCVVLRFFKIIINYYIVYKICVNLGIKLIIMKNLLLNIIFIGCLFSTVAAQNNEYWTRISLNTVDQLPKTERTALPKSFEVFSLNFDLLLSKLVNAPSRDDLTKQNGIEISFPDATGTLSRYKVYKAQIMHPDLAARYSEIVSYVGVGIDDPTAVIRFSTTVFGLHTMLLSGKHETTYIDPLTKDLNNYIVYFKSQVKSPNTFSCDNKDEGASLRIQNDGIFNQVQANNSLFRKYRLAISTTIEYSNFHINQAGVSGGTDAAKRAAVLAAMVVTMTRVNGLFERDCAITMELIPNNSVLISIGTDNFSNTSAGALLNENQAAITSIIGSAGFDIGHIFSTGGGGVASLGSVCNDTQKARGVTGSNSPVNDPFNIDYVAHEIGHQFGATHTFNGDTGNCAGGNRSASTAVEPGSGTTIMAYAGICAPLDVQANSDDHFHAVSMAQIDALVAGSANCSANVPNNNAAPVIQTLLNYTIPVSTPFVLIGNATDANNPNTLTYCWEQTNTTINAIQPTDPTNLGPNFRSRTPSSSPNRYMPRLTDVLNNIPSIWEVLPSIARTMNFSLTVRDNSPAGLGGQTNRANMTVTFAGTAPFTILTPNTAVSWAAGSNQNITWDVAGTTANGINTPFVDVFMSTNGGNSFPILLASRVPNDGSETILVPNNAGANNRIMVMGNNNIFYDVSDSNFTITVATPTQGIAFSGIAGEQNKLSCGATNVSFPINYTAFGGFAGATTFSISGNPAGSTAVFSPSTISTTGSVTLTLNNLGSAVAGLYSMVVTSTSGTITKTLNLYLQVTGAFPIPTLTTPTNLAVIAPSNIALNWNTNVGITQYVVQVSNSNTFATLLVNQTISTNSFSFASAQNATDYFWRVAARNGECVGSFSAPFKFSTSFCGISNSVNVPLTISATGTPTVDSTLTIPNTQNVVINDVNVTLNISHTWINDLTVSLISPAGTIVQLFTNQCSATVSGFQNAVASFDDASTLALTCGASVPSVSGRVIPLQPLAAFNGQSSQGIWTLRVFDKANQDGGVINSWNLEICSNQAPLSNNQFDGGIFTVYPNPNNGKFKVEIYSTADQSSIFKFVNPNGQVLKNENIYLNQGLNQVDLDISTFHNGVFLLSIEMENGRKLLGKVVKKD